MKLKVIVIGAGPGGYVAAIRAAQKGAEVTVIEKENVGGTCLNWGCIPSKIFKATADQYLACSHLSAFGIDLDGTVSVNMQKLQDRKNQIIATQNKGILGLFQHHHITCVMGSARVQGPGMVTVDKTDGSQEALPYDRLILAPGTKPLNIPAFPFDHQAILSSNDLLSLETIPESILIVGGGVIGCEFAFILSALGSKVTIVEAMDRLLPLPSVDENCSKVILREMKKRKISVYTSLVVEKVTREDRTIQAHTAPSPFSQKKVKPVVITAQKMAVCIGRQSNAAALNLDTINVKVNPRGWIEVNEKMETSTPGIYAIGDVTGPEKVMLAHVASTEAEVAVDNAMGEDKTMNYDVIPGGIFTMPEVGTVGLSEAQAIEKGHSVRADTVLFRTLGKAQVINEIAGEIKIVSDRDTGKVLGVHMVGPHATDLIAESTLAIKKGCTVKEIADTIHAHPTLAEITLEAALKADDRPLHG